MGEQVSKWLLVPAVFVAANDWKWPQSPSLEVNKE
jgi:hypothetical protein